MQLRMRMTRTIGGFAAALLVLAGAADEMAAQGAATTGQIRGRVVSDEAAQPLAGAVIVARNMETGLERGGLTGESGIYVVRLLPPGIYEVRTEIIGFQDASVSDVRVALGQTSTVNFVLHPEAIAIEGIDVAADRTQIDVTDASVVQLVSREEIEQLPSLGRDFTDFINLSGLVAATPEVTTGGQFSLGGQRASQTNVQIDGVDANNAFFGENRGGSRIPFVFSLESINEFQVITNGYDVEYGNYSGGVVNVVTRGGTNEFSGTVYANYRSDALTSQDFAGAEARDYEVTQFAGRVSGPIARDRAFYLFSLDGQRRREPQLPLTRSRFGPDGAEADPALFEEVGRFFEILENRYGITDAAEGYAPFQTTNDVVTLFGRVDWTIDDRHRLSVRHNYANYVNDREWNPIFDFSYGLSRAEELKDVSHSFVTELQSVLGPRTFNVLRFQYASEERPRQGRDLRPTLEVNLSGGQRIRYGGTFAAFQNFLNERKFQVNNNFTHVIGDHTLKIGGNAIFTSIENQFMSPGTQNQGAGVYSFGSLDAFEAYRPSSYFRPMRDDGGVPFAEFDVAEWSVHAQDEWAVSPRLTATLGLRYDLQSFRDSPGRVVDVERAFGATTGTAPTDGNNISPRLALAYDVRGDGRSVLRMGAGLFYGRVPYVLGGNVQSTERPVVEVLCRGSLEDGDPDAPPPPSGYGSWSIEGFDNPQACAGVAGAGGVPTYTLWSTDFEFPETVKASVGYEQFLGDATRVGIDLLVSQSTGLYTVRNLNLRDVQFVLENEGGRRIFQPAAVFDPSAGDATANALRSRRNLELGDIYANYNDGRARAFSGTLEASHRLGASTTFRGSYTFTRAYDNSSYSCCTASSGFTNPSVGAFGPNEVGGFGDDDRSWGVSEFNRDHTIILSGTTRVPGDVQVAAFWRMQSGRPWGPEISGDLNGDGVRFNDRPFVFSAEDLPLAATGEAAEEQRSLYRGFLADNACVGDHVGQIIPRNSCRFPWFNRLDVRVSRSFDTVRGQRAELQLDLFNVLNGLNSEWGRYMGIFSSRRNLLYPRSYDAATNRILYEVREGFGTLEPIGSNLLLQFQGQLGLRYYF